MLSRRNMRLFNLGAMILITVAWGVRFYYFKKREEIVEKEVEQDSSTGTGKVTAVVLEKVEVQDGFWMVIYTIFVFPVLIFIFVVQELQPRSERLAFVCRNFSFLDYHIGKGLYLMLCAFLVLQHTNVTQWLVAIAVLLVVMINLVHPCLLGADPINGE